MAILPFSVFAQTEKKWEVGANLSFHNNNHSGVFQYNYDRPIQKTLYTDGGVFVQYHYTEKLSFLAELNYKTLDFTKEDVEGMDGSTPKKEELISSVLEIPIMVRYGLTYKKWKLFLNTGLTLNFHLKNPEAVYSHRESQQNMPPFDIIPAYRQTENLKDYFSGLYVGYAAGLGLSYQFNSRWSVTAEYRFMQSLGNNSKDKNPSTGFGNEFTIKGFRYNANQLSVGAGFRL